MSRFGFGLLCVWASVWGCGSAPERGGFSELALAARHGEIQTLGRLVAAGADPDLASGGNGWTPLLHAIHKRQVGAVEELLRLGADIDVGTRGGLTPLMMAAGYGHSDLVRLLLRRGADAWAVNKRGQSALTLAITGVSDIDAFTLGSCQVETVRVLLAHDPNLRQQARALGRLARVYVNRRCPDVVALLRPAER